MKKSKILICDINIREQGHYVSYSQYLIDNVGPFFVSRNINIAITFGFNLGGKHLLKYPESENVSYHFFDVTSQASKSYKEIKTIWNIVKLFAEENEFEEVIFMDFDQYQIPIGLSRHSFKISGIYFRPHHRISTDKNDFKSILRVRFTRLKKIILEKILLTNKSLKNIYILNDKLGVEILNQVNGTTKFKYIADPIFSYQINEAEIDKDVAEIANKGVTYLIFGSLGERKNITNVIKAYSLAKFQGDSSLLLVGPSNDSYYKYLTELIQTLNLDTNKSITILRKFVTNSEMEIIHKQSDISLLVYKNFFGSSGLLGQAALHKLFTIVPGVGLMAELSKEYKLGITANPESVREIAAALEFAYENHEKFNKAGLDNFYDSHKPLQFLKQLLGISI